MSLLSALFLVLVVLCPSLVPPTLLSGLLPLPARLAPLLWLPAVVVGCAMLARGLGERPRARSRPPGQPAARGDAGMSTAEYAVGTVAAVAFAGVLYAAVSSSATQEMVMSVVRRALTLPF